LAKDAFRYDRDAIVCYAHHRAVVPILQAHMLDEADYEDQTRAVVQTRLLRFYNKCDYKICHEQEFWRVRILHRKLWAVCGRCILLIRV